MLLIALTGPVGSGKTTLLGQLAAWAAPRLRVEGFLAMAEDRPRPDVGADAYDLLWVRTGTRLPFALRADDQTPPYLFNPAAQTATLRWAEDLAMQPPPDLLLLDEMGRLEAEGGGHMALWPLLRAARPAVVVMAVRAGLAELLEARLGQPFDVRIDAADPEAGERLRAACRAHADWQRVGGYGAVTGGVEVSVGSMLHGSQLPLRGLALSTTQAVLLTYAADGLGARRRVAWVSLIAAGLKALSPTGSRLRPMIAISAQGLLYTLSIVLLGWHAVGAFVGGAVVGAWAALQGLALQYLLVGDNLFVAYQAGRDWLAARGITQSPSLGALLGLWVVAWAAVAGGVTLGAWFQRTRRVARRIDRTALPAWPAPVFNRATALRAALRDLARPAFWAPLLVIVLLVATAGAPWHDLVWILLRAVTVGLLLFTALRLIDPRRLAAWLRRHGYWGPAIALDAALRRPPAERDL